MNEKKKVAILLPWLKMGGTNKIALHFMKELAEYCDVTLILSQHTGELLEQLPGNIHLIIDQMRDFKSILKDDLKHLRIGFLIRDVLYYSRIKMHKDSVDTTAISFSEMTSSAIRNLIVLFLITVSRRSGC